MRGYLTISYSFYEMCIFPLHKGGNNSLVFLYFGGQGIDRMSLAGLQIYVSHWKYLKVLCGDYTGKLGTKIDFILGAKYLKKLTVQGG